MFYWLLFYFSMIRLITIIIILCLNAMFLFYLETMGVLHILGTNEYHIKKKKKC